jgi:uncharacterized cofD-like protein
MLINNTMKNIVTIGGGTGSFVLLSGLKKYPVNLTAIVSMADDGGSTGRLRDELGVLPPGDVRQCLVALSESSEEMRALMNYRFENGGLEGHNFGNILISALEKISGNFVKGAEEAGKILNIKGEVIPVSEQDMRLLIKLKNGKVLKGEAQLDHSREVRRIGIDKIYLKKKAKACQEALDRIRKADMIVIGPGDPYGSILPNLLVRSIKEAIGKSKARVVYVCNLTNRKGQTDNFGLDDHVSLIEKYLGEKIIDYVIYNIQEPPGNILKKYTRQEGKGAWVHFNEQSGKRDHYKVIKAKLLSAKLVRYSKADAIAKTRSLIRHDPDKLAKLIISLL